jgi:hypothetical protein
MNQAPDRQLRLNAYLRNSGYHETAWKVSGADPAAVLTADWYVALARTAERAAIEAIFLPDSPGATDDQPGPDRRGHTHQLGFRCVAGCSHTHGSCCT